VLTKIADFDESFRRLGLNQEAASIAANIDGINSASEVAMLSGTDTFQRLQTAARTACSGSAGDERAKTSSRSSELVDASQQR